MSYKAIITAETSEMTEGLRDLRMSLSKANWLMRVLGLPPDQKKAFMEMQKMIRTVYSLQILLSATTMAGALRKGPMLLRIVGAGAGATGLATGLRGLSVLGVAR